MLTIKPAFVIRMISDSVYMTHQCVKPIHNSQFSLDSHWKSNFLSFLGAKWKSETPLYTVEEVGRDANRIAHRKRSKTPCGPFWLSQL